MPTTSPFGGRLCGGGSLGSAVPVGCWTTASASGPLGRPRCTARRPPGARPPGERAPGVVPPPGPAGRGPLREIVAGRWCAPREKVLGSHARLGSLGYSGEQVGHEVSAAALPAGSSKHRGDGVLQPLVSIGGNQFHTAETASGQRAQEGQPERTILAGAHVQAQDLRCPSALTPVATTTQTLTMRPPSRTFCVRPSNHR